MEKLPRIVIDQLGMTKAEDRSGSAGALEDGRALYRVGAPGRRAFM